MRTYDCQHNDVNSLEKELLFNEVLKLRKRIVEAEILLSEIELGDEQSSLKNKIKEFLE